MLNRSRLETKIGKQGACAARFEAESRLSLHSNLETAKNPHLHGCHADMLPEKTGCAKAHEHPTTCGANASPDP